MTDTSPAAELRAAADKLRPSSPAVAAHTVAVRLHPRVVDAIADWLDVAAEAGGFGDDHYPSCTPQTCLGLAALAVARAVLGEEAQR